MEMLSSLALRILAILHLPSEKYHLSQVSKHIYYSYIPIFLPSRSAKITFREYVPLDKDGRFRVAEADALEEDADDWLDELKRNEFHMRS